MSRIIEILLFLAPFAAFLAWRFIAPTQTVPGWLVAVVTIMVMGLLGSLLWMREQDASDGKQRYVPATLQDGRIVPGRAAAPP